MHRLFVGLRPPAPVRQQLLAAMGGVHGARWQSEEQLHLTLRFIGEVERPMAEDIALALDHVHHSPVEIALAGTGEFHDSRGRPNAVWAGVRPHEALTQLHHKIDQALVRLGLEPERRAYLPHITLARMRGSAGGTERFLADQAALSSAPFLVEHFLLFESYLSHEAAIYETVGRYPLA